MSPRPASAPAAQLLSNASRELRSLRILVERFESAAHVLVTQSNGDYASQLGDIQELDRLMQTINNIADFIERISGALPEDLSIEEQEALKAVNIEMLAKRLMMAAVEDAPVIAEGAAEDESENGDCVWF
ncbi:MAG: hypothetical protein R3C58_05770 [Parvularculaceae bacterium]